ncbi:DUF6207 family protein [Streptomyces africanus]|nr:DUF6207 family protein [Streptomyces africanus]
MRGLPQSREQAHVREPGLVVVDVAATDDDTALALSAALNSDSAPPTRC